MLTVQMIDINRVHLAISGLSDIDKNKTVKKGLRQASKFLANKGKSNLKNIKSGNLFSSLISKVKRKRLGALAGFGSLGKHAHLIDSGTDKRYTARGFYRGQIAGNNFWTNTVNTNNKQSLELLYDSIENAVNKITERNGK